jgi:hypothetical protein
MAVTEPNAISRNIFVDWHVKQHSSKPMEQNSPSETDSRSARQEFSRLYGTHRFVTLFMVPILRQMNPFYIRKLFSVRRCIHFSSIPRRLHSRTAQRPPPHLITLITFREEKK